MELINQHTKRIMEGCKERAIKHGLSFESETLEYIVTNRDLLELSPKVMIPTLYDYWVQDVEVLKEKGRYELYPNNPYETVINTRPAISFYNDNNPDWLNVMIFYHVLAHIDFFQNNLYFRHTWDYDFTGQALSDKRMITSLRSEKGRWVDYVIEFARGIDNLVAFHRNLSDKFAPQKALKISRLDYYFDVFLQQEKSISTNEYVKEIGRYNQFCRDYGKQGEALFFVEVTKGAPEFEGSYKNFIKQDRGQTVDLMEYLLRHSPFLKRDENRWMKPVIEVVRKTSLFFQPQIRTKIMNEGWASYWHEKLFLEDDRIKGHEVDFARVHAKVTSLPRVGLNPYAIGMRLFEHIERSSDRGIYSEEYRRMNDARARKTYDLKTGQGQSKIFSIRENLSDSLFIQFYLNQDFVDAHELFVAAKRLNPQRMTWQYYVKSRSAEAYREMVFDSLYHPPYIEVISDNATDGELYLRHRFEGKPLVKEFIANSLLGLEFLWGAKVSLETNEAVVNKKGAGAGEGAESYDIQWRRVVYSMEGRKLTHIYL